MRTTAAVRRGGRHSRRGNQLIVESPTWLGHPSSLAQLMLERMNAMMNETDEGHDWSLQTGTAMASNLHALALALRKHPIPAA